MKSRKFKWIGVLAKIILAVFLLISVLLVSLVLFIIWDNSRVVNTEYEYVSDKVPKSFDGYRICLVTDFHNAENYKDVEEAVKKAKPDIICIGGDAVSYRDENFDNAVALAEGLSKIARVFFTYGNHEVWSSTYFKTEEPPIKEALEGLDVEFLNDRAARIYSGEEYIDLCGFGDSIYDDSDGNFRDKSMKRLKKIYENTEEDALSILVFHRAQYFDMPAEVGFDIVLSGHLHGGHVNLPYIQDYILEAYFNCTDYSKGIYKNADSTMYVCGGIEKKDGIYRIFNTPEIITVELRTE